MQIVAVAPLCTPFLMLILEQNFMPIYNHMKNWAQKSTKWSYWHLNFVKILINYNKKTHAGHHLQATCWKVFEFPVRFYGLFVQSRLGSHMLSIKKINNPIQDRLFWGCSSLVAKKLLFLRSGLGSSTIICDLLLLWTLKFIAVWRKGKN